MKSQKNKGAHPAKENRERNDSLNKLEKGHQGLPGEYPARDDIMNRMNSKRSEMDMENYSRAVGTQNLNGKEPAATDARNVEDGPDIAGEDIEDRRDKQGAERPVHRDTENDDEEDKAVVGEEDLQALGPKDLSMDMGEDEQYLKNRVWPVDMAGSDLDVPGSELDDKSEEIGSEDEENNSYSLGGDSHEDNLEGK